MKMQSLDDLQRLTPSQGALLHRLVDLGYLTRAQVDDLINRLACGRFTKAMDYLRFAQQLNADVELNQPHIISRVVGSGSRFPTASRSEAMKLRETAIPYMIQEVDYAALRQAIEQAFVEEYGPEMLRQVRVAHFNPDVIDVTVVVQARRPEMDGTALELGEALRRQGLRVAIRISTDEGR